MSTTETPIVTVNGVQEENKVETNIGQQIAESLSAIGNVLISLLVLVYYICEGIYKKFIPDPPTSVRGEIVLITGTGHGIGKELALLYAREGATVVGWDINEKNNKETMKQIEDSGYPKPYSYVCDVSNRDDVFEVARKVRQDVGEITILINNAGIMPTKPLLQQTQQEIERTFGINTMAHFWTLQAFLPHMIKNNNGHIVSLASMAGQIGLVNLVPYCGSKFAVCGLMESVHEELRMNSNNRVKVTIVCPYMVDTGLCKKPNIKYESLMPLLKPKDVAATIMDAQRTNKSIISIPSGLLGVSTFGRLLPTKAALFLKDRFNAYVESE